MNPSTEIIGPIQGDTKGADLVPPSLDRAREFARHSKAESTLRGLSRGLAGLLRMVRAKQPAGPSRVA